MVSPSCLCHPDNLDGGAGHKQTVHYPCDVADHTNEDVSLQPKKGCYFFRLTIPTERVVS
jgi:hypothetical protein